KLFPHAWSAGDITPDQLLQTRRAIASEITKRMASTGGHVPPSDLRPEGGGIGGGSGSGGDKSGCSAAGGAGGFAALFAAVPLLALRRRRG
ncbi:MAG TPA: Synerg-CTERM sorting domain-containing protein, partial [Vulgatibacter sp.]